MRKRHLYITGIFLLLFSAGTQAQTVKFLDLLGIYRGTLNPKVTLIGAELLEPLGAESQGQGYLGGYHLKKGAPGEANVMISKSVLTGGRQNVEVTYLSKDTAVVSTLQNQVLSAGFTLSTNKALEELRSWTYSKDSTVVQVEKVNNGNQVIKLFKKPGQ